MNSVFVRRSIIVALLTIGFAGSAFADQVLVVAASDLSFPIKEIITNFERATGHTVKLTLGSSGSVQAQIANGAPFDVYLSADVDYVRRLDRAGLIEPNSLYVYAVGRLVIWVPNGSHVQKLGINYLLDPAAKRIAIANPDVAPYGRAAVAALRHSTLTIGWHHDWSREKTSRKRRSLSLLARAADIGIIARSIALSDPMRSAGKYLEIPSDAHPSLD
jgi:molybdate transport system substrate-binding protein